MKKTPEPPWLNAELKAQKKQIRTMYPDAPFSNSSFHLQFKDLKRVYHKSIKKAKIEYYLTKLTRAENKSKCAWEIIETMRNHTKPEQDKKVTCNLTDKASSKSSLAPVLNFLELP